MTKAICSPIVAVLLAALTSCGGRCGSRSQPTAASTGNTPRSRMASTAAADRAASGPPTARRGAASGAQLSNQPPGQPPRVALRGIPQAQGRAPQRVPNVQIAVRNQSGQSVSLNTEIRVEREAKDGWKLLETQGLSLRWSCERQAGKSSGGRACLELAPGAEFLPPPWQAASGKSQCTCDPCEPAAPGRYRFVLEDCKREYRIEGQPFKLPPSDP